MKKGVLVTLVLFIVLCALPSHGGHWSLPAPSPNQMHLAGFEFEIVGSPAQVGDEVAVFDSSDVLVGLFVVTSTGQYGDLAVFGDDASTPGVDEGASNGESLFIRAWSQGANREYRGDDVRLSAPSQGQYGYSPAALPLAFSPGAFCLLDISVVQSPPALTLTRSGTGSGTIASNPSGISCGDSCIASYTFGTFLTLTATTSSGSCFVGWGAPCSGYGTCSLTLTGETSLTATFQPIGTDFCDVTPGTWAEEYINTIFAHSVTTGCATGTTPQDRRYCPSDLVTRAQMAAFIVRAREGEPPSTYCAAGSPFTDVDQNDWSCKYIKKLKELNLTVGYGGDPTIYMPNLTIPRDQMAAFIIRAIEGEPQATYCDSGSAFTDVPASSWSCKYIKRLRELNLTTGYGGNPNIYQPALMVPRDQMAAFLGRAFYGMQ